jgi:hypothetical protein
LELIALDLSSLIKSGHIEQPSRYLKILLANEDENRGKNNIQQCVNIFFSIIMDSD